MPCDLDELLADELAMPFIDLGLVEVEAVLARGHDERDVARLSRLDHVCAVDPVHVAAEEAMQQVDGAVRAAPAFRALLALHLIDGNHGGEHDVALEVV